MGEPWPSGLEAVVQGLDSIPAMMPMTHSIPSLSMGGDGIGKGAEQGIGSKGS